MLCAKPMKKKNAKIMCRRAEPAKKLLKKLAHLEPTAPRMSQGGNRVTTRSSEPADPNTLPPIRWSRSDTSARFIETLADHTLRK
jgi:hypothetical protein